MSHTKTTLSLSLSCLLILLFSLSGYAGETGKIAGKVSDKSNGDVLIGANIVITAKWVDGLEVPLETAYGASTDVDGFYFILNVPPGIYTVSTNYIGYSSQKVTGVKVQIDKTTELNFEVEAQVIEGQEVEVLAFVPQKVEKDVTATKVSYSLDDLENLPGINSVGDILNLQADVNDGHFRGGRTGESLYLVNGASIVNPLNSGRSFDPIAIGLKEVEVYTSGFSAEYGNVQSGVINLIAKEGSSLEWKTNVDVSSTNSYYKTHGGSVFGEDYNEYFETLNNPEEWAFGTDPISGVLLWSHFGLGFDRYLPPAPIVFPPQPISRADSVRTAELIRVLWLQSVRAIGMEYDAPDYRVDFSTGGPISDEATFFVAAQQQIVQPFLPTGRPDVSRQIASNVTFKPNDSNKFQILYNFNNGYENAITSNYFRWFENILNVAKETNTTHQFGFNWNHLWSTSTFIDVKFSRLSTFEDRNVELLGDSTLSDLYGNSINWRDYTAPTGYQVGKLETTTGTEATKTYALNTSVTSQIDKYNLLKAGFQLNYYDIDVSYLRSRTNLASLRLENYKNNPYEGALYVQDKLEFEGIIANLGARLDFYDFNTDYFTDKFSPYRNPNFDPNDPTQGSFYDEELADKEDTSFEIFAQPRIGISFPVSEKAVMHLNYGVFTQRPAFERVLVDRLKADESPNYERLGNPRLEPERTISYDVGLVYSLPLGFYLDVSSYLKDVTNLLQFADYVDNNAVRYFTFDNREYANIKGFQVNLERNRGMFGGSIRYNWESAKGKSGSATGSGTRSTFDERGIETELASPEDVFLDYDRTHKLVVNSSMNTNDKSGPEVFGFRPFAKTSITGTYRMLSGRPYTWDPSGQGLQFNRRTPTEHNLKVRLNKGLRFNKTDMRFYFEAFNLLNDKVFNYTRTFEDPAGIQNLFKEKYETDRENLLTQDQFAPLVTSLEGFLYGNQPRHYRFGLELKF
ncbi:MAG: TonB-dependent receptor [Calditrichia bacterium]